MASSYDKNLDKITEAEVVYDFVHRVKLGKPLEMSYNNATKHVFSAVNLLVDVLKFIIGTLKPSIVFDDDGVENIRTDAFKIPVGSTTVTCLLPGNKKLSRAFSERTGIDIASCFTITYDDATDITSCTITTDTEYLYEDYVTIYTKDN